jgi:hypothetical protein
MRDLNQLEIYKSVCMFIVLAIVVETDQLSVVLFRWLPIMTSWRKVKQSWMLRKHAHIPDNDYWGICLSLMRTVQLMNKNIYIFRVYHIRIIAKTNWFIRHETGGIFTKLFMHVSSRNMFPTTRNLQIRVHVYRPRHCCGDWSTFGCFVPLMRTVQLMNKNIYIFRVYHIRIIAKTNWFIRHETDRFLNNHCQECVRAYEASMIV